jgi:hypothetical protein
MEHPGVIMFKTLCVAAVVGVGAGSASAAVMDVDITGLLADSVNGVIRDEGALVWEGQAVPGAIVTARITYDTLLGSVIDYLDGKQFVSGPDYSLPSAVSATVRIGGTTKYLFGLSYGLVDENPKGLYTAYVSRDSSLVYDSNSYMSFGTDHYISGTGILPNLASSISIPFETP